MTVLANLAPLFFQKCARACFSYALSNRCQIARDSCKNNAGEFICLGLEIAITITQMKIFQ